MPRHVTTSSVQFFLHVGFLSSYWPCRVMRNDALHCYRSDYSLLQGGAGSPLTPQEMNKGILARNLQVYVESKLYPCTDHVMTLGYWHRQLKQKYCDVIME